MIQKVETHPLPSRPMLKVSVPVENDLPDQVLAQIRGRLSLLNPDAVVRVELTGSRAEQIQNSITAASSASSRSPVDEYLFWVQPGITSQ